MFPKTPEKLYEKLVENPEISVEDLVKEYNDEWFLKVLCRDEDIQILKNSSKDDIKKELDNIKTSDNIKNLMKEIFKY